MTRSGSSLWDLPGGGSDHDGEPAAGISRHERTEGSGSSPKRGRPLVHLPAVAGRFRSLFASRDKRYNHRLDSLVPILFFPDPLEKNNAGGRREEPYLFLARATTHCIWTDTAHDSPNRQE